MKFRLSLALVLAMAGNAFGALTLVKPNMRFRLADEGTFLGNVSTLSFVGSGISCTIPGAGEIGVCTVSGSGGGGGGGSSLGLYRGIGGDFVGAITSITFSSAGSVGISIAYENTMATITVNTTNLDLATAAITTRLNNVAIATGSSNLVPGSTSYVQNSSAPTPAVLNVTSGSIYYINATTVAVGLNGSSYKLLVGSHVTVGIEPNNPIVGTYPFQVRVEPSGETTAARFLRNGSGDTDVKIAANTNASRAELILQTARDVQIGNQLPNSGQTVNDHFYISTGPEKTEALTINLNNHNVGLGTGNQPSSKLDVNNGSVTSRGGDAGFLSTGTFQGGEFFGNGRGLTNTISPSDEGTFLNLMISSINCVGAGVTCTGSGQVLTLTIPGAAGGGGGGTSIGVFRGIGGDFVGAITSITFSSAGSVDLTIAYENTMATVTISTLKLDLSTNSLQSQIFVLKSTNGLIFQSQISNIVATNTPSILAQIYNITSTNAAILQSQISNVTSTNALILQSQIWTLVSTNSILFQSLQSQHNTILSTNAAALTSQIYNITSTNAAILQSQINAIISTNSPAILAQINNLKSTNTFMAFSAIEHIVATNVVTTTDLRVGSMSAIGGISVGSGAVLGATATFNLMNASTAVFTSSVTIQELYADNIRRAGTINLATNPVDWSELKNVPAGFADGTDDGAGGAGAGDGNLTNVATQTVNAGGFGIVNISSMGFSGSVIKRASKKFSASAFRGAISSGAGDTSNLCTATETITNKINFDYFEFNDKSSSTIAGTWMPDDSWDMSFPTITIKFKWFMTTGTASTDRICMQVAAIALSSGNTIDGAAYGSSVTIRDTFIAANQIYVSSESLPITIGNLPVNATDAPTVYFKLTRQVNDGVDTSASMMRLMEVDLYYNRTRWYE